MTGVTTGTGASYPGLKNDSTVGSSSIPNSRPKSVTPDIITKNMRLDGTVTVESISTDINVVNAEVVSDRPILVTAIAARSLPESDPSVSTKACVM